MEQVFKMISAEELSRLIRMADDIHILLERTKSVPSTIGTKEIKEQYGLTQYQIRERIKKGLFPKPLPNFPKPYLKWNRDEVVSAIFKKKEA